MSLLWCVGTFPGRMPGKNASPAVERRLLSGAVSFNQPSNTTLLPVRLQWAAGGYDGSALLDSGAEGSFIDRNLVHQLRMSTTSLRHKIPVSALNGQSLSDITHSTLPVTLITSGNHTETMTFYVTDSPLAPVVLGHPWLVQHNPRVNWAIILFPCGVRDVMRPVLCACSPVSCVSLQDEAVNLSNVPEEYLDLKECSVSPGLLLFLHIVL